MRSRDLPLLRKASVRSSEVSHENIAVNLIAGTESSKTACTRTGAPVFEPLLLSSKSKPFADIS